MLKRSALLVVSICVGISACAANQSASQPAQKTPPLRGSDCVFFSALYDWQPLDDHNMVIWAPSKREAYHVYFMTPLVGLNFSMKLAFVDRDHDGRLCGFSRDQIVVPDAGFPQRATIDAMKRLDAAGIAQLEQRYHVQLSNDSKKQKPKEPDRETAK